MRVRWGRGTSAAVAAAALLLGAAPAGAAGPPVTVCSGLLEEPVAGDVRVPRHCQVMGVHVGGDLVVAPGAYGAVESGSVGGDVHVGRDAVAVLAFADVGGGVHLDRADRLTVDGTVARSIRGSTRSAQVSGHVGGAINVAMPTAERLTDLWLHGARVGGWVNVYGGRNSIQRSDLRRGLTLSWTQETAVCGTSVVADTTVRHARRTVQLNDRSVVPGSPGWGDGLGCGTGDDRNRLGAALRLLDNTARVIADRTDVAGDLECRRNARAPQLRDVVVGGARLGDC